MRSWRKERQWKAGSVWRPGCRWEWARVEAASLWGSWFLPEKHGCREGSATTAGWGWMKTMEVAFQNFHPCIKGINEICIHSSLAALLMPPVWLSSPWAVWMQRVGVTSVQRELPTGFRSHKKSSQLQSKQTVEVLDSFRILWKVLFPTCTNKSVFGWDAGEVVWGRCVLMSLVVWRGGPRQEPGSPLRRPRMQWQRKSTGGIAPLGITWRGSRPLGPAVAG